MEQSTVLTWMVFTPLLGAALILLLPSRAVGAIRWAAAAATVPPLLLAAHLLAHFDPQATGFPWTTFLIGVLLTVAVSSALWLLGRSRIAALDLATRLGLDLAASEARAKAVMDSAVEAIVKAANTPHWAKVQSTGTSPARISGVSIATDPTLAVAGHVFA